LALEIKTGKQDRELWVKALAMADGDRSLRKRTETYFRLKAERQQKEAEEEKARLVLQRQQPYVLLAKQQEAKARALRRQVAAKRASSLRRSRRIIFALVFTSPIIVCLIIFIDMFVLALHEQTSLPLRNQNAFVFLGKFMLVNTWLVAVFFYEVRRYRLGQTRR